MEGDGDRVGEGAERHCYSTDKLSHNTCFDPQQHLSPLAFTTKIKKIIIIKSGDERFSSRIIL